MTQERCYEEAVCGAEPQGLCPGDRSEISRATGSAVRAGLVCARAPHRRVHPETGGEGFGTSVDLCRYSAASAVIHRPFVASSGLARAIGRRSRNTLGSRHFLDTQARAKPIKAGGSSGLRKPYKRGFTYGE